MSMVECTCGAGYSGAHGIGCLLRGIGCLLRGIGCLLRGGTKRVDSVTGPYGYDALTEVFSAALQQASSGKGKERHASAGERFEDQQICQLGRWMGSTHFEVGQAVKKALESTRLPEDRARAELLGAINYLAAAYILLGESK